MIIQGREYPDVLLPREVARLFGVPVKALRRQEFSVITRGQTPAGQARYHRDSVLELWVGRGGDPADVPMPL